MCGAYVAKPDAAAESPDVPDGWDEDWSFPGPNPPGYTPVLSIDLSASGSISYDGAASIDASLRDHVTYATVEPLGCSITWTATIGGETVNLRFSGGEDYATSLSSDYSEGDTYWGAEPEIEFELTEDNDGDTIILTATSMVAGQSLSQTSNVEVANTLSATIAIQYELIGGIGEGYYYGTCYIRIDGIPYFTWKGDAKYYVPDHDGWWGLSVIPEDEITLTTLGDTATFELSELRAGEIYEITFSNNYTDCVCKATLTVTVAGEDSVFVKDYDGNPSIEITIDGDTGAVAEA